MVEFAIFSFDFDSPKKITHPGGSGIPLEGQSSYAHRRRTSPNYGVSKSEHCPYHPLGLLSVRYQMDPLGSLGQIPAVGLSFRLALSFQLVLAFWCVKNEVK